MRACGGHSVQSWCYLYEYDLATGTRGRSIVSLKCDLEQNDLCRSKLSLGDYSPSGGQVLFWALGDGLPDSSSATTADKVYVVNRDGTGLRRVSTSTTGYNATWAPNGGSVLFTVKRDGVSNIFRSGTSSSSTARLLIGKAGQANWQPLP
jgi:Tol biopolymer transport system component